jgi:[ribosomal protein S18]-alanine N-acetyltransferase
VIVWTPLDLIIRPISKADEPFLWEMLYQAIFVEEGDVPRTRDILKQPEIARYIADWGRDGDYGLIALDASTARPIGAAWLRLFTAREPGYGYIADGVPELSMAVLDKFRGQGVGTALLGRVIEDAKMTYLSLCLSVSRHNPALHLYERFGFKTVGATGASLTMQASLNNVTSRLGT